MAHVHYADPFGASQQPVHSPQVHLSYGAKEKDYDKRFCPFGPGAELFSAACSSLSEAVPICVSARIIDS